MELYMKIAFLVAAALNFGVQAVYFTHMLQLNSYRPERYKKWCKDNDARLVTAAGRISPGWRSEKMAARASSCARRRDNNASPQEENSMTRKLTAFPTLDKIAISRVEPSAMPRAVSFLGIRPVQQPRSTNRS